MNKYHVKVLRTLTDMLVNTELFLQTKEGF